MNRIENNKEMSTIRTAVKNNTNPNNEENDKDNNPIQTVAPEIAQPNPSSATPTFPSEMPIREIK